MKKGFTKLSFTILVIGVMSMLFSSCEKEEAEIYGCIHPSATNYSSYATADDGSCEYSGEVMFWYNSNGTSATINIGGKIRYISSYYSSAPSCGSSGCATFTLPIGSYNFMASSTWSTWSGTVSVTSTGCSKMLLY